MVTLSYKILTAVALIQIDFWSLVDVRIIKHGDSDPAKADDDSRINEAPSRDQEPISGGETTMNKNQMVDHTTGAHEIYNLFFSFSIFDVLLYSFLISECIFMLIW